MPSIKVRDGEPMESAMRRLKRLVEKAGYPKEWRKREFYVKGSTRRQREKAAAKKRLQKRVSSELRMHHGDSRDRK
jgi:small subunit ribosomal protein S21